MTTKERKEAIRFFYVEEGECEGAKAFAYAIEISKKGVEPLYVGICGGDILAILPKAAKGSFYAFDFLSSPSYLEALATGELD